MISGGIAGMTLIVKRHWAWMQNDATEIQAHKEKGQSAGELINKLVA